MPFSEWTLDRLSEDELAAIEFFNLLSQDEAKRQTYLNGFLSRPQEYLSQLEGSEDEVYNGPIVGLIVGFAFNWVTAGLTLALITLGAGLVQWAISESQKPAERKADPRFAETYAGNVGAGVVKLGEPIPAIFCNRDIDPTGGVQTAGQLVFSRIATRRGVQNLLARYVISHGIIGSIDLNRTLVNDQPISSFSGQLNLSWLPGDDSQVVAPEFRFWCQNYPLSNNNRANIRLVDDNANISGNRINFTQAEYETKFNSFAVSGLYLYDSGVGTQVLFRITNKISNSNTNTYYAETSPPLPAGTGALIFEYQEATYQTTKPVNEIHLNFNCSVWGRNSQNELIPFAQLFELRIKTQSASNFNRVCQLYILSLNPRRILRGIDIVDLPLDTYVISIVPRPFAVGDVPIYELWDYGFENYYSPNFNIPNSSPRIRIDGYISPLTTTQASANISQLPTRAPSCSPQQTAALEIGSINEVETVPAGKDVNMRGLATVEVRCELDAAINGSLNFTFFVARGILTRQLLAAGTAGNGSNTSTLVTLAPHGQSNTTDLWIANHSKRRNSTAASISNPNTIVANNDLALEAGDTYSLFKFHSSCWWPEIYAQLCLEPRFGVESKVIADYYLDWENLVETISWLQGNNEFSQKFAWHGILTETENLATLNEAKSRQVMLQPWRGRGLSGYHPYRTPAGAIPIFNAGNASDFRIEYTTAAVTAPNQLSVVYQEQEQIYIPGSTGGVRIVSNTVTVTVRAAYQGQIPLRSQTLKIPECTSRAQAIKTAQIYLNQARYGGRVSASHKAKTIESIHYYPGSLYRLMSATTTYKDEQSGIALELRPATNEFRLDREFTLVRSTSNFAADAPDKLLDDRIDFILAGVSIGDLIRNLENGAVSTITAVSAHTIDCSPAIPKDTHYEIADLTPGDLVAVCFGDAASVRPPTGFSVRYDAGHIWLKLNDNYLPGIGDAIGIGRNNLKDRLFQTIALTVRLEELDDNKVSQLSVELSGVNWDERFFDFSDLVIQTRDGTFNV